MTEDNIVADDIADMRRDLQLVLVKLAALEALIQSEGQRCPHRELVARIEPDSQRIAKIEDHLTNVRLDIVRMGVASGGASSVVMGALFALGKAAGWW